MKLKPIEEFIGQDHGLDSNGQLIKIAPLIISPNNYFCSFNTLKRYDTESANIILPIKIIEKYFEPIEYFNFIEWSKNKKQFIHYYQAYKRKEGNYYIVVDTERWEDGDTVEIEDKKLTISSFYYDSTNVSDCQNLIKDLNNILQLNKPAHEPEISIVLKTMEGYVFKKRKIKSCEVDITKNYNDDFKEVYDAVVDRLANGDNGLVCFYGLPGSGKTYIIRHLTSAIPNKNFVMVPSNIIPHLADPAFLTVLMDNKDCVLVLEDAEVFLKDRSISGDNNVVSTILNLSDGMFSDFLGLQIICTFNADTGTIDKALMREGRLIAEYEFKELTIDKCKLHDESIDKEMTLAEVYNRKNKAIRSKKEKKQIGFGR